MSYVYLDIETTGLNPLIHATWEVAWAVNTGPVESAFLPHVSLSADPKALEINGYRSRFDDYEVDRYADTDLSQVLDGATLVAANPAFDSAFLLTRWGRWGNAPWKYRMLDIEAFAMPALGLHEPKGLAYIAEQLDVQPGDHTAAEDVRCLRECHVALLRRYGHNVPALGVTS